MNADIVIRRAQIEDIDAMANLIAVLFSVEEDFFVDITKQRQALQMFHEYPDGRCLLVAEQEHRIIGMCSAQLLVSSAEGGWKVLVEDVVVAENCRGLGVAKRMLCSLTGWAEDHGAKRMDLLADKDNTNALQFYDKAQWRRTKLIALQKKI